MSKEVEFYEKNEVDYKTKFFRYMDSLVSHKTFSRIESIIFISISYLQLISGFFSEQVEILVKDEVPDNYLMLFQKVIRIRDLFQNSFNTYTLIMYILFIMLIILTFLFIYRMRQTQKVIFYSISENIINFFLKIFIYILYQPILDFCLSLFCFGNQNKNFSEKENITCSLSGKIPLFIVTILTFFYTIFLGIFLSIYYNESFMLSNNFLSRISSKFELYLNINAIFFSIILNFSWNLGGIIFILYNVILSYVLLRFYLETSPYYDSITNFLVGFYIMSYTWASYFSLIFKFIYVKQVSICFLFIWIILFWMHYNLHRTMDENISLNTPFHKLKNKFEILLYIKYLITKFNSIETNNEDRAEIVGIINLHKTECTSIDCPSKIKKKKFYLPITDEWSKPNLSEINDRVYLFNFITFVFDFYINQNIFDCDILMNYSLYFLQTIGNQCQAMYYYQLASNEHLSLEEEFMLFRTSEFISKALVKTTKPSDEIAGVLEELNTTMYFKYQDLSEKFFTEILADISLSTDFWRLFITKDCRRKKLDFNKIFSLTDKIRLTKQRIDDCWKELFQTYTGCNEIFDLYECYVEYINDDNITLRELMKIRNKNFALEGVLNYYNVLFNNNTGIIVCSGDKGKEGMIEKVSENISDFFIFKEEELKGMNIGILMPRIFEKDHIRFMQRNINIGEKRVVDKTFRTYAKDKNNALIVINISIKLLPILRGSTYFCALINKENLDDCILLDQDFNIQGMSGKLLNLFNINSGIFQDCDVPFWMISKEFIHHYQTFMMNNSLVKNSFNKNNKNINNNNEEKKDEIKKKKEDDDDDKYTNKNLNDSSISSIKTEENQDENNINEIQNGAVELDFEINENADVQWELVIPPLFKLYIADENKQQNFFTNTMGDHQDNETASSNIINENSREEDDVDETGKMLPIKINESSTISKSINQSYAGGEDHDKEFQNAIGRYRTFFNSNNNNNFNELINLLDKLNEGNDQIFKFVISFTQIKYADKKVAYLIRCIDNKDTFEESTNDNNLSKSKDKEKDKMLKINFDNQNDINNKKGTFDRRKYLQKIKNMEEETNEDVENIIKDLEMYGININEDENLKDKVDMCHQEILIYSRVLGQAVTNVLDENGSQNSSSSAYTNSITKKTRVQEIKSHIMGNVGQFYTLRFIKFLFIIYMLTTILFAIIYIIQFNSLSHNMLQIDNLHNKIFQLIYLIIENISIIASLRSLKFMMYNYTEYIFFPYTYNESTQLNHFDKISAYNNYIYIQKELIKKLYNISLSTTGEVGYFYSDLINSKKTEEFIFQKISETFSNKDISIIIEKRFIIEISNIFSSINNLINTTSFNFPYKAIDENNETISEYYQIEITINRYKSLIPQIIKFGNNATYICSNENNINSKIINILIYICIVITSIFSGFYSLFLYLTNKNMEDGLIKISRIDPILIDETLKTIDMFNKTILSRFRRKNEKELEEKSNNEDKKETKLSNSENENNNKNQEKEKKVLKEEEKDENEETIGYYDLSLHKRLTILSYSYFQSIILIVIFGSFSLPIFFILKNFINNSNDLLVTKEYFLSDIIKASLNILNLKLKISNTNLSDYYEFENSPKINNKDLVSNHITKFEKLKNFYQNKYILSICLVLYDINSDSYKACKNDDVIGEYCNVEGLYKLLDDNIFTITRDFELKSDFENNYNPIYEYTLKGFKDIEHMSYKYILFLYTSYQEIFEDSEKDYINDIKGKMVSLLICMIISIWIFSLYIILKYINVLIRLLLISRCIFKIIPTRVINQTKELEDWIDDKY